MFINYFLTLQQKFNHFTASVLNVSEIKFVVMLQIYDIIKISCIIINYNIMTERSFIVLTIKKLISNCMH